MKHIITFGVLVIILASCTSDRHEARMTIEKAGFARSTDWLYSHNDMSHCESNAGKAFIGLDRNNECWIGIVCCDYWDSDCEGPIVKIQKASTDDMIKQGYCQ